MAKARTFEIYRAGVGFIGYVTASTPLGARRVAAKLHGGTIADYAAGAL
jgi:hypothetical protein